MIVLSFRCVSWLGDYGVHATWEVWIEHLNCFLATAHLSNGKPMDLLAYHILQSSVRGRAALWSPNIMALKPTVHQTHSHSKSVKVIELLYSYKKSSWSDLHFTVSYVQTWSVNVMKLEGVFQSIMKDTFQVHFNR